MYFLGIGIVLLLLKFLEIGRVVGLCRLVWLYQKESYGQNGVAQARPFG
jgi:hypothetical protein